MNTGNCPPSRCPINILYVEFSPYPSYGGSKRVLTNVIGGLDRTRWAPHVLYHRDGRFREEVAAMGVWTDVIRTPTVQDDARPAPPTALGTIRRSAGVERSADGSVARSRLRKIAFNLRSYRKYARGALGDAYLRDVLPPRVDLFHLNASMHDAYEWVHLAHGLGIPFVTHEHQPWREPPAAFRRVAARAAAVLCLTPDRADLVRAFCGGRVRTELVPNGIDPYAFRPRRTREDVREELGVRCDVPLLVTPGHMQEWKGQWLGIEAAAKLAHSGVQFHWVFCGSHLDPAYVLRLREKAIDAGLTDRVRIYPERFDLPDVFLAADLHVHTSVIPDPFPMVVLEAMNAGLAVVGPDEGGIPHQVHDGHEGLIYRARDVDSLVAALRPLLRSPEERKRLGNAAQARVRQDFTIERQVARLCAIYERALGDKESEHQTAVPDALSGAVSAGD
jgi:glycosyltransferase involved in cell wall biosynthesis